MAEPKAPKQPATRATREGKAPRSVFVIMPFRETSTRSQDQLTSFFEDHIKRPIERARLANRYTVRRSDDTFNITEQIIKDLYVADIVICDLSGVDANPNVMYELGMRLAFSNRPVILIREQHAENHPIFDIAGFYAEPYDPLNYAPVTAHLIEKLRRLETGKEAYRSPVLSVLGQEVPLLLRLSRRRAWSLLNSLADSMTGTMRFYCVEVHSIVKEQTDLDLALGTINEFLADFQEHLDKISLIDWSALVYEAAAQPALDYYIATRYLDGIVDSEVEELFTMHVIHYHALFLSGSHFFKRQAANLAHMFIRETLFLIRGVNILMELLRAADETTFVECREAFFRNIDDVRIPYFQEFRETSAS